MKPLILEIYITIILRFSANAKEVHRLWIPQDCTSVIRPLQLFSIAHLLWWCSKQAERLFYCIAAAGRAVGLTRQVIRQECCCAILLWRAAGQHLHDQLTFSNNPKSRGMHAPAHVLGAYEFAYGFSNDQCLHHPYQSCLRCLQPDSEALACKFFAFAERLCSLPCAAKPGARQYATSLA